MLNKEKLEKICRRLRFDILNATSNAGSGHPTSCLSAVELMATLFFAGFFKQDINNPSNWMNDRIVFSKGHSAPLLYSLYHLAGAISYQQLLGLRSFTSVLEGHPIPRFSFVDAATGSLGQGLSLGVGMALGIKLKLKKENLKLERVPKVFVLLGDSEMAEGQVWEAMATASYYRLNNLVGIIDMNRLGQRGETMLGWDLDRYQKRVSSFGWQTIIIEDGHDLEEIFKSYQKIDQEKSLLPLMIIAKTVKGKGISFLENQEGWHGKVLTKEQEDKALKELGEVEEKIKGVIMPPEFQINLSQPAEGNKNSISKIYCLNSLYSTREAYGDALVDLGETNRKIVVFDAEVSNSTYAEKFAKQYPDRFFEMFIAEQNMISAALGISKLGFIPFVSSFAAFLTRGFDQLRMAQYSDPNLKIVGSHAGVSIGPDGPSQMGLEDIAMARSILNSKVFYPADAVSTYKLTKIMAENKGLFYLRTTRAKTPVIYNEKEEFKIGGSKVHRLDKVYKKRVVLITAGVTLFEALTAQKKLAEEGIETVVVDCYSIKPLDEETIIQLAKEYKNIIVVEDHYPAGGLGEAVSHLLTSNHLSPVTNFVHLCVRRLPRSGSTEELLRYEEIDSQAIIKAVKNE